MLCYVMLCYAFIYSKPLLYADQYFMDASAIITPCSWVKVYFKINITEFIKIITLTQITKVQKLI